MVQVDEDQHGEIMVQLAELVQGVRFINEHLARLNSKVATHEGNINMLMLWKSEAKGFANAIGMGWSLVISLISGSIVSIFYWLTHR